MRKLSGCLGVIALLLVIGLGVLDTQANTTTDERIIPWGCLVNLRGA